MSSPILYQDILTRTKVKLAGPGIVGSVVIYENTETGELHDEYRGLFGGDSIDWLNEKPDILYGALEQVARTARLLLRNSLSSGELFFEVTADDPTMRRVPALYWQTPPAEKTLVDGLMHSEGMAKFIHSAEEIDGRPVFCNPDLLETWLEKSIGGYGHVLMPESAKEWRPGEELPEGAIELFPIRAERASRALVKPSDNTSAPSQETRPELPHALQVSRQKVETFFKETYFPRLREYGIKTSAEFDYENVPKLFHGLSRAWVREIKTQYGEDTRSGRGKPKKKNPPR